MGQAPKTVTLLEDEIDTLLKSIALLAQGMHSVKNADVPNPLLLTDQFLMSVTGHALFVGTIVFKQTGNIPEAQVKLSGLFISNGGTFDTSKGDQVVEVPPKK